LPLQLRQTAIIRMYLRWLSAPPLGERASCKAVPSHGPSIPSDCVGAPVPAVVNPEDIELGDGMDEDGDAQETAGEVLLQQKAVPVRSSPYIMQS